jgi:hypothetical protein
MADRQRGELRVGERRGLLVGEADDDRLRRRGDHERQHAEDEQRRDRCPRWRRIADSMEDRAAPSSSTCLAGADKHLR